MQRAKWTLSATARRRRSGGERREEEEAGEFGGFGRCAVECVDASRVLAFPRRAARGGARGLKEGAKGTMVVSWVQPSLSSPLTAGFWVPLYHDHTIQKLLHSLSLSESRLRNRDPPPENRHARKSRGLPAPSVFSANVFQICSVLALPQFHLAGRCGPCEWMLLGGDHLDVILESFCPP